MSIFNIIKDNITAADVAEKYNLKKYGRLYECPFHPDKTPSMQVGERFYCYGCNESGDAIDLTAKIFDLRPKEAAEKIANDFGLSISDDYAHHSRDKPPNAKSLRDEKLETIEHLIEYEKILKKVLPIFAPKPEDETMSRAFLITQNKLDIIDDLFYHFYQNPTDEEIKLLIEKSKEIIGEQNE